MHGCNKCLVMAKSICKDYDIILLQEHWLLRDNISKLGEIDLDFAFLECLVWKRKHLKFWPFDGEVVLIFPLMHRRHSIGWIISSCFSISLKKEFPVYLVDLISNWCLKQSVTARWNGFNSDSPAWLFRPTRAECGVPLTWRSRDKYKKFKAITKTPPVPFVLYDDFEAVLVPSEETKESASNTIMRQLHKPSELTCLRVSQVPEFHGEIFT